MMKFKILVLLISLFEGYPLPLIVYWEQGNPVSLLAFWGMGSPLISLAVIPDGGNGAGFPVPLKE
jgi:hypothetical protein